MAQAETTSLDRRAQIIQPAIESLKEVGYAGTSIREIARRGDFNSALISNYFGGLHKLPLAALDHSSEIRMRRYTQAVKEASGLEELMREPSMMPRPTGRSRCAATSSTQRRWASVA